ncbi:hypothetical protein P7B02_04060 [Caulobacter segnis]|uniref:hypothetical protein n=1 Tax=Caulobacter segnis TaxID=88688 RepID=UPI00240FCF85|nr:hypothetical protein [Caulobacter segnis]MDG2520707.1 hypothetical protein [Caulobacter segnis]
MLNREDHSALNALSDALADAAGVHRAAAGVAEQPALRAALSRRAERLAALSAQVRADGSEEAGGWITGLIDRLRLTIDQWFDDNDEAAQAAGRDSKASLLRLIDSYLVSPELSAQALEVFIEVRRQIAPGRPPVSEAVGLKALPS